MSPPVSPALHPQNTSVTPSSPLPVWPLVRCGALQDGERLLADPVGTAWAPRAAPWAPHPCLSRSTGCQPPASCALGRAPGMRPGCSSLHGWGSEWLLPMAKPSPPLWGQGQGQEQEGVPMLAQPLPGPRGGCSGQGLSQGPPVVPPGLPPRVAEATRWYCEATVAITAQPWVTSRASPGPPECPLPSGVGAAAGAREEQSLCPQSVPP